MKNIFLPLILLCLCIASCEKDESLNPLATVVGGQFASLNITKSLLDFNKINTTSFGGILTTPSNNIVKYDLYVRYTSSAGFTNDNYVLLKTITSFPVDLDITPIDLATALNKNLVDFKQGDKFRFLAYTYDSNGIVCDYNKLAAPVRTQASMKQGYKFVTQLETGANLTNFFDNYGL